MTGLRGWWRRRNARHTSPWPIGELESLTVEQRLARENSRIGPQPPRVPWPLKDRQSDPALSAGRLFPRPDAVPRVLDRMPHHH